MTTISFKASGTGSPAQVFELTNLGAQRVAQQEPPGYELARSGRTFVGGMTLVAGGVVPVVDLPTTTGPFVLYNSNADGGRVLVVKRITSWYASGTAGAGGHGLFAGVTPSVLATALTSNDATNFRTQSLRGYGTPAGFVGVAKTIPAGTAWMHLGGIMHTAVTVTGIAYSVDLGNMPFVVPPRFALTVGVLGDTGTTAKYGFSVCWDEVEAVLP